MKTLVDREDLLFSPPELGCVLYLPGSPGGDSRICDRSPYGNHGTITGATWVRLPSGLWCLSFDGTDDYAATGYKTSLNPATAITIELWIKANSSAGYPYFNGRGYFNQGFSLNLGNSKLYFWVKTTDGNLTVASESTLNTGVFYHIVGTYDSAGGSNNMKVYINGVLDAQDNLTGAIVPFTSYSMGAYLGRADTAGSYFDGLLAAVCLYNRALTALEVGNHFNQEKHLFGVL